MAKKASLKDDTTGAAPGVPFEAATTGAESAETLPVAAPEITDEAQLVPTQETEAGKSARAPLKPARVLNPGRLNRVTLAEARALRR